MSLWSHAALVALAAFGAAGCQPDFTPPSEIHGVRVLAVRQEPASGAPGATVDLQMLVTRRDLSIGWISGCNNPPGRQYFSCAPELAAASHVSIHQKADGDTGDDPTHFAVTLPDDILSAAPKLAADPVHYGVSYVFFAVCDGTLTTDGRDGYPFGCVDEAGAPVGPSGFVIGFATLYSYDGDTNTNPVLGGIDFDGVSVQPSLPFPDASGQIFEPTPCAKATEDVDCANVAFSHRAVCSDDGVCAPLVGTCQGKKCPKYPLLPHVDPASFETFTGANEVMWASFYTTLGSIDDDTRLVDDRVNGPTRDLAVGWRAPAPDGTGTRRTATVWVTLNDQRGGATWGSFDVVVE